MLGEAEGDKLYGNLDNDIIFGDSGRVIRGANDVVERIVSTDEAIGGNDQIEGNEGADMVVGGVGEDVMYGQAGDDVLLGDSGVVVRADGSMEANDIYATA